MSQVGEEVSATYTRGENGSPATIYAPAHIRDVEQFAVVHQKLSTSAATVVAIGITQIHTSWRQNRASATTAQVATVPATAAIPADAVNTVSHFFSSVVTVHGSQEYQSYPDFPLFRTFLIDVNIPYFRFRCPTAVFRSPIR